MTSRIQHRVISFSLWGDSPFYNRGAIENVMLAKQLYPGWICRFYCDHDVPAAKVLQSMGAQIVYPEGGPGQRLFWRFLPISDPHVTLCLVRDCDSRLNAREAAAVAGWLTTGRNLHTMHDHEQHCFVPIMGGMWGIRGGSISNITELIAMWSNRNHVNHAGPDQDFLMDEIWPRLAASHVGHCRQEFVDPLRQSFDVRSFIPFPPHQRLEVGRFVGEPIPITEASH